jgi:hypothetical protein
MTRMNGIGRIGLCGKTLSAAVVFCLVPVLLVGCASALQGDQGVVPSTQSAATATVQVDGRYWTHKTLDSLIGDSPIIVAVRVVDFRYDVQYDVEGPNGEEPASPDAVTVITVEVTEVFAGSPKPGEKIEVYQLGGVMDKVMYSYDQVPYLPGHRGEDLVLFLQEFEFPSAETASYRVSDSFEWLWSRDIDRLSLVWGAAYDSPDGQSWNDSAGLTVPGAVEFPVAMTVAELQKAIAEHK